METTKEQWLEQRRYRDDVGFCVQASEVSAIIGFDIDQDGKQKRTALDIYVQKKTGKGIDDNDQMLIGRCMEDGIAKVYQKKTGRPVFDPGNFTIFRHPDLPWLGSTQDRVTWKTDDDSQSIPGVPLELKNAGHYKLSEWKDEIPIWLQIQLQIQIACSSSAWGAYCGIVGGSSVHYGDIDRNDAFLESTIPVLEEFKWRLDNDKPPAPDSPKCLGAIKRLYPNDSGETIALQAEHMYFANQWEAAKANRKATEDDVKKLEAKIRAILGEATFGALPDGSFLSLKTTNIKERTTKFKAISYRTLRRSK